VQQQTGARAAHAHVVLLLPLMLAMPFAPDGAEEQEWESYLSSWFLAHDLTCRLHRLPAGRDARERRGPHEPATQV
jgi:hypothetical protein